MLEAAFNGRETFLVTLIIISLLIALSTWGATRRENIPSRSSAAFAGFLALVLGVTMFLPGGQGFQGQCVVNRNMIEPFRTEQGLLNLVMFIPLGFFALTAFRSLLPVALGALLTPVVVELAQGTVPSVGRSCDSSDVQMNVLGGLAGVCLGWVVLKAARAPLAPVERGVKQTLWAGAGVVVVCASVWKLFITPVAMDDTSLQLAGSKEEAAARKALDKAFGGRYGITKVQKQSGQQGSPGQLFIALPHGNATLSWPDTKHFNVSLESSSVPGPHSFSVQSSTEKPENAQNAFAVAQDYARARYAWALPGSIHETHPVGEKAEFGWITSWRHVVDGVLMPMRLDVQINRAGRVSQLNVREGATQVALPPQKVDRKEAERKVRARLGETSEVEVRTTRIEAVERDGKWRALWVVAVIASATDSYAFSVDAETGTVSEGHPVNAGLGDGGA